MKGRTDREATVWSTAGDAIGRGVLPLLLKVAELFLMIVIGVYIAKICVLAMGIQSGDYHILGPAVTIVIEVAMLFITLDSLLSVSSRRPKAWKKVVRAAALLAIFNLYYWSGLSESLSAYVVFNPLVVTPLAVLIILMMFSGRVRDYYVPPLEERKPVKDWVKFALFWPLYTSESYRVRYDGKDRASFIRVIKQVANRHPCTPLRRWSPHEGDRREVRSGQGIRGAGLRPRMHRRRRERDRDGPGGAGGGGDVRQHSRSRL